MRRFALLLCAGIAIVVAGCSSASSQLVGTWKGDIVPPAAEKKSDDIGDKLGNAFKGFLNSMLGPMTIEFNADGKYKVSMSVASETGTYTVSGNEVTLVPDDKDPNRKSKINIGKLILASDGKSLHNEKEFNSDSDFELKKQDTSAK
jgi:hypothetical protein